MADRLGAKKVLIVDSDQLQVKDMLNRTQESVSEETLLGNEEKQHA
jgi:hypothetical protein